MDETIEIWKEIVDYPNYKVSNMGRVQNIQSKKFIQNCTRGYLKVYLSKGDNIFKGFFIHRLVAFAFLPPPLEHEVTVDHINRIKDDNRAENLRWTTFTEQNHNKEKGEVHQPKKVEQYDLDGNYITTYNSTKEASEAVNGDKCTIAQVCQGITKTCKGFVWKYKENEIIENEIWKEIDFEGFTYKISNKGRIEHKHDIINYGMKYAGYRAVQRYLPNGKKKTVALHKLIATAFIPEKDPLKTMIHHKDGDMNNNDVGNLMWISFKDNTRGKNIIQKDKNTLEIIKEFPSIKNCSKEIGISKNIITDCLKGRRECYKEFIFEYK